MVISERCYVNQNLITLFLKRVNARSAAGRFRAVSNGLTAQCYALQLHIRLHASFQILPPRLPFSKGGVSGPRAKLTYATTPDKPRIVEDDNKREINMTTSLSPIAILGAGSWGTALAIYLARQGQDVRLWSFNTDSIHAMQSDRANLSYLPNISFPDTLNPTAELSAALQGTTDIMIAVPSAGFRSTLTLLKPLLNKNNRILWVTKGIDLETGQLLHEVAQDIFGHQHSLAVLSGPSFASEVAKGLPTAVVVASSDLTFSNDILTRFNSSVLRVYSSQDMTGVEIGGVVKNVLAIACGISDGMGFGANARSALITRGLAEMTRLGIALHAQPETFTGLAGVGDLVLTCTDNQSRNRRFGLALGQGKTANEAEQAIGQVVEGKRNAELLVQLAHQHKVEMPISEAVWDILQGKLTPYDALLALLSREPKQESE